MAAFRLARRDNRYDAPNVMKLTMNAEEKARFEEHAAPVAIARQIDRTERWIVRLEVYLDWLYGLSARRARQVEAGEWP